MAAEAVDGAVTGRLSRAAVRDDGGRDAVTGPIDGIGGVLHRIAALEARFAGPGAADLPSTGTTAAGGTSGSPAVSTVSTGTSSGDATFASSLAQATAGTLATGGGARTVGVAGTGAGAVRGISALARSAAGIPTANPVATTPVRSGPVTDVVGGGTGAKAVEVGRQYLGVPYRWGGTSPSGFDCSGFVQYVFRKLGVDLPRVSRDQARAGQPVASLADARPGDLVAFGSPVDHIGIYAGGGKMVAAPHTGANVRVQDITRPVTAIRRVA